MKKHYFLLLAAGCLSCLCLSVNAQNRLSSPMSQRGIHHPKNKKTAVLPARQVLTRATAEALPDSMVLGRSGRRGKILERSLFLHGRRTFGQD